MDTMVFIAETGKGKKKVRYVIYTHGPDYAEQLALEMYYSGNPIPEDPVKFKITTLVQLSAEVWG